MTPIYSYICCQAKKLAFSAKENALTLSVETQKDLS